MGHYKDLSQINIKSNFRSCKCTENSNLNENRWKVIFGHTEIEKQEFHQHTRTISINNIDINKIAVPNKVSFDKKDFKYFTGYNYAEK